MQCFGTSIKVIDEAKYDIILFVFMYLVQKTSHQSEIFWLWENEIEKLFSSFKINVWFIWFSKQTVVTSLGSGDPLKVPTF